ncbi:MAG: glycoside hydrolase family 20 zincin-like fold domain-containing protein, partial [Muribaculaceae bacterium]|nr:glycoside hydrolase family 20 zincin-like fold domain-containing protein [Muribaculaceae bacterium]
MTHYTSFFSIILTTLLLSSHTLASASQYDIVPRPADIQINEGEFHLSPDTKFIVKAPESEKQRLINYARQNFPVKIDYTEAPSHSNSILLELDNKDKSIISPEGYRLDINDNGIVITSPGAAGLFYGLQTLIQLADEGQTIPFM